MKSLVALLLFVAVAMGVHDKQDKNNQSADQEHDDNRFVLPKGLHEIGSVRIHSLFPLHPPSRSLPVATRRMS